VRESQNLRSHGLDRHRRRPGIKAFPVSDELVLVAQRGCANPQEDDNGNRALTLNGSGRAIWELCDGSHTVADMVRALEGRFPVDRDLLSRQVPEALAEMSRAGFIEAVPDRSVHETGTVFVIGIEDKPYFWWQTAIFLESFRGKLPRGWRTLVVVCNDGNPLSDDLNRIVSSYGTEVAVGKNHDHMGRIDAGDKGGQGYSALNRIEALAIASGHVNDADILCLLDSDIFLFGDLNTEIMPSGCAAPRNWHIAKDLFFSTVADNQGMGIDLRKLLEAIGCEADFKPGGVNVFVTGKVAKNEKYVADCFRFAEAIFLLGRIAAIESVWMAEMPCFTLAMTANGIPYDLLEAKELRVSDCHEKSIPAGTLYHYYSDPRDTHSDQGAFHGSKWYKHVYMQNDFLKSDFRQFAADASTDHEKYFFQLATNAKQRRDV